MQRFFHFAVLPLFLISGSLTGQEEVSLRIPEAIHPGGDDPICVPVLADSFPNIVVAQFSLSWDTAVVDFAEVRFGDDPLSLSGSGMTTNMPEPGVFVVAWTNADVNTGITLAAGTPIFELCLTPKVSSGSTPITFDDFLEPEFARGGTIVAFPFTVTDGSLSFGADVATFVLPGDLNDDGQVDHRDIVALGHAHGSTGPARPAPGPDFRPQIAPLWPDNLLRGTNFAHIDADGNGTINSDDQTPLQTYYDQFANDTWVAAPPQDNAGAAGSPLTLSAADISAGQPVRVSVNLGDTNNSPTPGHGMAFALLFDPNQIDPGSISVDFNGSFLGEDLLTITRVTGNTPGRLEIGLSRKDQINTTSAGGLVCTLNFTPAASESDYRLSIITESHLYQLADQTSRPVTGQTSDFSVSGTTTVREPEWANDLSIFPNPLRGEVLSISSSQRVFDRISLWQLDGRCVREFTGNERRLPLNALPAGTYLIRWEINGQQVTRRLIKK